MSIQITSIHNLKDSQLLYDKRPPAFALFLLAITMSTLLIFTIWSFYATKPYIVKGNGSAVSENRNYIMSSYTGEISEIFVEEGSYVEQGDLLALVQSADIELQQEQLKGQIELYKKQISQYEKLIRSIQDDVNYFDETVPEDQFYYYQYESYQGQVAQTSFDASTYQSYGYTDEQIQILIEQNQGKVEQAYYSTLQSAAEKINELKTSITNTEIQLSALGTGADAYSLYATTSGIVHMDTEYKTGMVVQAGAAIGSIANENDTYEITAYISLNDRPLIHEGDSCKIAVSGLTQSIYGTLTGTVDMIESDITTINGNDGTSGSFFKIHVIPDSTYLVSKSGEKVSLSNGMGVEVRVIYDEVTYFRYVMEALGVLTR